MSARGDASRLLLDPPGLKVFVEGTSVSTGVRDTSIRLGVPGLDPEGDRIDTTVYGDLSISTIRELPPGRRETFLAEPRRAEPWELAWIRR